MKLNVFYSGEGTDFSSVCCCEYMNFLYDMNSPIKEKLSEINENGKLIKNAILEDEKYILSTPLIDEEKNSTMSKFYTVKRKLSSNVDEFLSCYDKIEVYIENVEILDKINYLIEGINIPIILNLRELDDQIILEKLPVIDNDLRNNKKLEVKYLIKQCQSEAGSHFEDNSYSLEDVLMVLNYISGATDIIKNNNLSPFEQVMFIYDMVKDHKYVDATSTDSYLESRDLAKILKGDKRVCVGFATLFKSLLDDLGFTNEMTFLDGIDNPTNGHVRNMVVVNDSKYNLNHILYFDATWDCKKEEKKVIDIDRYNFFARERFFFVKKDYGKLRDRKKYNYYLRKDNDYSFLNNNVSSVLYESKKFFRLIDWEKYFSNIDISSDNLEKIIFLMTCDHASILLRDDIEFCEFFYKECCKMLNRKISDTSFLRCLYTVRRMENNIEPNKYDFDKKKILDCYFDYTMLDSPIEHKKLVKLIFSDSIIDKIDIYEQEDKNINRLEVLNRLKNLCNSISENKIDMNTSVKEAVKIMKK